MPICVDKNESKVYDKFNKLIFSKTPLTNQKPKKKKRKKK